MIAECLQTVFEVALLEFELSVSVRHSDCLFKFQLELVEKILFLGRTFNCLGLRLNDDLRLVFKNVLLGKLVQGEGGLVD